MAGFGLEQREEEGARVLSLSGTIRFAEAHEVWSQVREAAFAGGSQPPLVLDLAGVGRLDGGVAALLTELQSAVVTSGGQAEIRGANDDVREILELYGCGGVCERPAPQRKGLLTQIGEATADVFGEVKGGLEFIGALTAAATSGIRRPATVSWGQTWPVLERAGADGLPIVLMIGFLVGFIMAFQGAVQLEQFGASIFVADLVGLTVTRELGPLMTAIVVCGRSGAAFAAELGTMKVSEEIDALEVMSIDPARFLVMPRIVAMAIMTPLLTVFSDVVAIIGGGIISMTQLNVSWPKYYQNVLAGLSTKGIYTGLFKALIFGLVIAIVSCSEGLRTTGGAVGVGRATRRSVILCYLLILILGYFVTAIFYGKGGAGI